MGNKTYGELLGPAMKITEQEEADKYLEYLIGYYMESCKCNRAEAVGIAKSNLGYYSGYYNQDTFERVHRLFGANHPVFGSEWPTTEEAFEVGRRDAKV